MTPNNPTPGQNPPEWLIELLNGIGIGIQPCTQCSPGAMPMTAEQAAAAIQARLKEALGNSYEGEPDWLNERFNGALLGRRELRRDAKSRWYTDSKEETK